jgi:phosphoribosylanthranilate isomerase
LFFKRNSPDQLIEILKKFSLKNAQICSSIIKKKLRSYKIILKIKYVNYLNKCKHNFKIRNKNIVICVFLDTNHQKKIIKQDLAWVRSKWGKIGYKICLIIKFS